LAAAGYALEWTETVAARIPLPDERTTLHMPVSTPVLITHRLTLDAETGRPLVSQELSASADSTALTLPPDRHQHHARAGVFIADTRASERLQATSRDAKGPDGPGAVKGGSAS
jgi:hypothetical protein